MNAQSLANHIHTTKQTTPISSYRKNLEIIQICQDRVMHFPYKNTQSLLFSIKDRKLNGHLCQDDVLLTH